MHTNPYPQRIIRALALGSLGVALWSTSVLANEPIMSMGSDDPLVQRGEFLVHNVVLCIDCHSPRNERGEFIPELHLRGAVIPFAPIVPMPEWGPAAPLIAGLPPGWSEEAMMQFLTTGVRPNGLPPTRPPMPPYRLEHSDAQAVVAYLKALGTGENM